MASNQLFLILTSILSGLSITSLLVTLGLPQQAIAQVVSSASPIHQVTFEPPPGQDRPDQTAGGGSRGSRQCPADMAAANSVDNMEAASQAVALHVVSGEETTVPYPTIDIQVPETSATAATFSFLTEEGHVLYEAVMPLDAVPDIVSVALPEHQPGLAVGERYYWMFALVCDPENRLLDVAIGGTVKRVGSHASYPSWQ
ncbi:MAG: DUF928 domain-containing protein [Leptolyngbya sp. DLM2.Bin15]|nr:MAG: DUF928 domain-containing protein [Leptolyngbya sp. DLM2.Bin15]